MQKNAREAGGSFIRRAAWVFAAVALSACSQGYEEGSDELGSLQQSVQFAYVNLDPSSTTKGVNLVRGTLSDSQQARSTGAVGFQWTDQVSGSDHVTDGRKNQGNCGATFISPTYAVTAAHCVPKDQLVADTSTPAANGFGNGVSFWIKQFRTANLDTNAVGNQSVVTGSWPNYTRPYRLRASDGYEEVTHWCVVKRRCSSNAANFAEQSFKFGRDSCPFTQDVDIALVHCPYRTTNTFNKTSPQNWVSVATSDNGTGDVDAWWFHEIVNLSITEDPYVPYQPSHNYLHYMIYRPCPNANCTSTTPYTTPPAGGWNAVNWPNTQNYHYWAGPSTVTHTYLPLVSRTDSNGTNYRRVGHWTGTNYTNVNTPICHGTSGSGYMTRTSPPRLLGPAVHGPGIGNRLCHDINAVSSSARATYAKQAFTVQLEALAQVQNDR